MNCNHPNNNHCHECEKAKHRDFLFMVLAVVLTVFGFWFAGWEIWKYLIWPWVFLVLIYIAKYYIDKEEAKKKKEKEQEAKDKPKKESNETKKETLENE